MVLDAHDSFRTALVFALNQLNGIDVIGEAVSIDEILSLLEGKVPDIVLIEIDKNTEAKYDYINLIKDRYSEIGIFTVGLSNRHIPLSDTLKVKIDGHISKPSEVEYIEQTIKSVYKQ